MKVGLIGESVTMHYLDYYCETHKDRIAGFSDVRDDKKYQEDDIDFIVYRKDGSSFTVEAKADTYKTGNVFLETAVNSFAIGEDDKLLRFGKYQKAIAKHSKGWLYKEADYIFYYFIETRQIYVFERMAAMHYLDFALCSDTVFVHDERRPFGRAAENKEQRSNYMQYYGTGFCVNAEQMRRSDVIDHRMHRVGNKSLRFPERIEPGKVFEHFVNHTCIRYTFAPKYGIMQVQIQKVLYVVLMHNIFRSGHCMWHFCVDKICEWQIIGSRVIYLFFGRVTSPEYASVAQMAEQLFCKQQVAGSNPVGS